MLSKNVTLPIINQADSRTTRIEIYDIHTGDKTVWARLYDKDDNLTEDKRVYAYDGEYKNIPVALGDFEVEFLDGEHPADKWDVTTIKLWLDGKQAKDEDGKVLPADPYYYTDSTDKADLLALSSM